MLTLHISKTEATWQKLSFSVRLCVRTHKKKSYLRRWGKSRYSSILMLEKLKELLLIIILSEWKEFSLG